MNIAEQYKEVNPKFYCFPLVKTVIGFRFANLLDAVTFNNLVQQFTFKGDIKLVSKEEKKNLGLGS